MSKNNGKVAKATEAEGIPAPDTNTIVIDTIKFWIVEGVGELAAPLLNDGHLLLERLALVGGWPASQDKSTELGQLRFRWAKLVRDHRDILDDHAQAIARTAFNMAAGFAEAGVLVVVAGPGK